MLNPLDRYWCYNITYLRSHGYQSFEFCFNRMEYKKIFFIHEPNTHKDVERFTNCVNIMLLALMLSFWNILNKTSKILF